MLKRELQHTQNDSNTDSNIFKQQRIHTNVQTRHFKSGYGTSQSTKKEQKDKNKTGSQGKGKHESKKRADTTFVTLHKYLCNLFYICI